MAGMPHLVKVQEQYKQQGLIIVGSHLQDVTEDKVVALCKSKKVNYTIVSNGRVQGDEAKGLPHAFLFDASGKCVKEGHPDELKGKLDELMRTEPHWITRGRKLETDVKKVAEGLKAAKPFGWALHELEALLKKTDEKLVAEATFLKEQISAEGDRILAAAQAAEADDAGKAQLLYDELAKSWKKTEYAEKAEARSKELKKDKTFQEELKAAKVVAQIEELVGQLIAQNGHVDLSYAPNRPIAQNIAAGVKQLKAKHGETKAAKRCLEGLKAYGF